MKKILFMACTAALLAIGCQKTEVQNEVLTPIGFDANMGKLTKAPDAANDNPYTNLYEQGFRVWGYFATEGDLNYAYGESYFDEEGKGIHVSVLDRNATPATWTTGETYYWPGKGKELDIYAVSSWNEDYDLEKEGNVTIAGDKVTIKDFVVDANADNDLMVATKITQDQDDAVYIEPQFKHALTKVVLNFCKYGDNDVYVVSAKTSKITNKSTLEVFNDNIGQKGEPNIYAPRFVWGTQEGEEEYKAENTITLKTLEANTIVGTDGNKIANTINAVELTTGYQTFGSWLLLPQGKSTEQQTYAEMSAENYYLDVVYIVGDQMIEQRFDLTNGGAIKVWARNQQTTYNVKISPDDIQFAPEVGDWVESDDKNNDYKVDYNS